jgi:light-harvesting complex I chlorophyll a/b binding protein 4
VPPAARRAGTAHARARAKACNFNARSIDKPPCETQSTCKARADWLYPLFSSLPQNMALMLSIQAQGFSAGSAFSAPGAVGVTAPFGFFDPLGLTKGLSESELQLRREAELAHGRVAMVGALGFLVQETFHPIFPQVDGPAINQLTAITTFSGGQTAFAAMSMAIAFAELNRARTGWIDPKDLVEAGPRLQVDYSPGDLGFDPIGALSRLASFCLASPCLATPRHALWLSLTTAAELSCFATFVYRRPQTQGRGRPGRDAKQGD